MLRTLRSSQAIAIIAALCIAVPALATDTCTLYFESVGKTTKYSRKGNCGAGACTKTTFSQGGIVITTCYCGQTQSTEPCLGEIHDDHGTITRECKRNACSNSCVNPAGASGTVCDCPP